MKKMRKDFYKTPKRTNQISLSVIILLTTLLFFSCTQASDESSPTPIVYTAPLVFTPDELGPENELLLHAAQRGDLDLVKQQLTEGAAVNSINNSKEYTPLHAAVNWDQTEVVTYLLDNDADVNAATARGATPLMLLMRGARIDMVRLLIEYGAQANVRSDSDFILESWLKGFTFFYNYSEAAGEFNDKQIEILKLLLENGAAADYHDEYNKGLLAKVENKFIRPSMTDFSYFEDGSESVTEIIVKQVNEGISDDIHVAYAEKKQKIIELLTQYGAQQ